MSDLAERLRAAGCVYADEEAALLLASTPSPTDLEHKVAQRVAGSPLEQVLGWAEFAGLRIAIDAGVFVPRRRTELLVRTAADLLMSGDVVVDVCCGSGAVAAGLSATTRGITVHACDVDPVAVGCARRNLPADTVHQGDLLDALPAELQGHIAMIVANAPYVPTDEIATMPPEARDHEPRVALDGGADGLDVHRRLAAAAPTWLRASGCLLVETSAAQATTTAHIFTAQGFTATAIRDDELDATVVMGVMTP